jgi:hypothetical protein
MVAEMGTADHGACRDRSNHWTPAQIILKPVTTLPALTGSIIERSPLHNAGAGHIPRHGLVYKDSRNVRENGAHAL